MDTVEGNVHVMLLSLWSVHTMDFKQARLVLVVTQQQHLAQKQQQRLRQRLLKTPVTVVQILSVLISTVQIWVGF